MNDFSEIYFKEELLNRYGLPNIGYPVPEASFEDILETGGEISFPQMLYWLQEYSAQQKDNWQNLEPAISRLSEILAPEDERDVIVAEGETWSLEIGPVDLLHTPIVTVQRRNTLIAAIAPRQDFRLRAAVYHPLDANSIHCLVGLALRPNEEHGVCMRPNNWEYALDQASHPMSAYYACEAGQSYLSLWEYGLGIKADGNLVEPFSDQRTLRSLKTILGVTQIGVYYTLCTSEFI
jgi:hypothetical protein